MYKLIGRRRLKTLLRCGKCRMQPVLELGQKSSLSLTHQFINCPVTLRKRHPQPPGRPSSQDNFNSAGLFPATQHQLQTHSLQRYIANRNEMEWIRKDDLTSITCTLTLRLHTVIWLVASVLKLPASCCIVLLSLALSVKWKQAGIPSRVSPVTCNKWLFGC